MGFDKNIFRQKREKDTRIKNSHKQNKTKNHLCPTRQTIIFVQLDKQSSLSKSTNNHLRPTRRTIIFVKSDKQSSLSNSTNNHPCHTILSQSNFRSPWINFRKRKKNFKKKK